ncbi:ArsR/SmtB family transcription factor [Thermotomaculum hydrothermale]|nr:metalloregulator ArsR/SmtB family transcription factor [Thermotomaculum hydrothermale]
MSELNWIRAKEFAKIAKVFSTPLRVYIVGLLEKREYSVGELAETLGIKMPTLSKHLSILRDEGIVKVRKDAQTSYYSCECTCLSTFHSCAISIAKKSLEERKKISEI